MRQAVLLAVLVATASACLGGMGSSQCCGQPCCPSSQPQCVNPCIASRHVPLAYSIPMAPPPAPLSPLAPADPVPPMPQLPPVNQQPGQTQVPASGYAQPPQPEPQPEPQPPYQPPTNEQVMVAASSYVVSQLDPEGNTAIHESLSQAYTRGQAAHPPVSASADRYPHANQYVPPNLPTIDPLEQPDISGPRPNDVDPQTIEGGADYEDGAGPSGPSVTEGGPPTDDQVFSVNRPGTPTTAYPTDGTTRTPMYISVTEEPRPVAPSSEFGPGPAVPSFPSTSTEFGPGPAGPSFPSSSDGFGTGPAGPSFPSTSTEFGPGPAGPSFPSSSDGFGTGPAGPSFPSPSTKFGPGPAGPTFPSSSSGFGPGPAGPSFPSVSSGFGPGPAGPSYPSSSSVFGLGPAGPTGFGPSFSGQGSTGSSSVPSQTGPSGTGSYAAPAPAIPGSLIPVANVFGVPSPALPSPAVPSGVWPTGPSGPVPLFPSPLPAVPNGVYTVAPSVPSGNIFPGVNPVQHVPTGPYAGDNIFPARPIRPVGSNVNPGSPSGNVHPTTGGLAGSVPTGTAGGNDVVPSSPGSGVVGPFPNNIVPGRTGGNTYPTAGAPRTTVATGMSGGSRPFDSQTSATGPSGSGPFGSGPDKLTGTDGTGNTYPAPLTGGQVDRVAPTGPGSETVPAGPTSTENGVRPGFDTLPSPQNPTVRVCPITNQPGPCPYGPSPPLEENGPTGTHSGSASGGGPTGTQSNDHSTGSKNIPYAIPSNPLPTPSEIEVPATNSQEEISSEIGSEEEGSVPTPVHPTQVTLFPSVSESHASDRPVDVPYAKIPVPIKTSGSGSGSFTPTSHQYAIPVTGATQKPSAPASSNVYSTSKPSGPTAGAGSSWTTSGKPAGPSSGSSGSPQPSANIYPTAKTPGIVSTGSTGSGSSSGSAVNVYPTAPTKPSGSSTGSFSSPPPAAGSGPSVSTGSSTGSASNSIVPSQPAYATAAPFPVPTNIQVVPSNSVEEESALADIEEGSEGDGPLVPSVSSIPTTLHTVKEHMYPISSAATTPSTTTRGKSTIYGGGFRPSTADYDETTTAVPRAVLPGKPHAPKQPSSGLVPINAPPTGSSGSYESGESRSSESGETVPAAGDSGDALYPIVHSVAPTGHLVPVSPKTPHTSQAVTKTPVAPAAQTPPTAAQPAASPSLVPAGYPAKTTGGYSTSGPAGPSSSTHSATGPAGPTAGSSSHIHSTSSAGPAGPTARPSVNTHYSTGPDGYPAGPSSNTYPTASAGSTGHSVGPSSNTQSSAGPTGSSAGPSHPSAPPAKSEPFPTPSGIDGAYPTAAGSAGRPVPAAPSVYPTASSPLAPATHSTAAPVRQTWSVTPATTNKPMDNDPLPRPGDLNVPKEQTADAYQASIGAPSGATPEVNDTKEIIERPSGKGGNTVVVNSSVEKKDDQVVDVPYAHRRLRRVIRSVPLLSEDAL